jgi:hypothetical protein
MAIYNAVKHAIETDAGHALADLSKLVTVPEAWDIADWWTGNSNERRRLREEIRLIECSWIEERARRELLEVELRRAEDRLEEARLRVSRLEAEVVNLNKGVLV